jgi:hypothetical protein
MKNNFGHSARFACFLCAIFSLAVFEKPANAADLKSQVCQSAPNFDPQSASKIDPYPARFIACLARSCGA